MLFYTEHCSKVKERETSFLSGEATGNVPFPTVLLQHLICHLEFKYNPNKNTSLYSVTYSMQLKTMTLPYYS